MQNPLRPVGVALKAAASLVSMRFSRATAWAFSNIGATAYNFRHSTGDPAANAMIGACIAWMQRTYPEAPVVVRAVQPNGDEPKAIPDHPLAQLLHRPNDYYSGLLLWAATIADFSLSGNAYWLKVRSGARAVVQLWWVPSDQIEPRWPADDSSVYISHYDYTLDGIKTTIPPEDVVHFRNGLDPNNVRKGRSPVQSLIREVATDNEAANWTASMLRNMGVPGVVISAGTGAELDSDDAEQVKATFMQRFGGDRKGEPLVLSSPASVQVLSFSPEQMQMRELRRVPEERVTALFGIPAIVAGLGAGLDRSTFANFAEAREAAYESNVIPTQRLFAEELMTQLVPDFGDPTRLLLEHDYSNVRILQADINELHARAREDLLAGLITRNQALALIGEKADETPGGDALYVPTTVSPVAAGEVLLPRLAPVRETVTDASTSLPETPTPEGAPGKAWPGWLQEEVEAQLSQRPAGLSAKAWRTVVFSQADAMMQAKPSVKKGDASALIRWYEDGADGQIDWGSPGDFDDCVAIAGGHMDNPEGFCQERHIAVTGEPAGHAAGE